jgi:hypothetical protein
MIALLVAASMLAACGENKDKAPPSAPGRPSESGSGGANRTASPEPAVTILRWGPASTQVGQSFNVQANGVSAVWFEMEGEVPPGTMQGWLGDRQLDLAISSKRGGSLAIPADLLAIPGKQPIYLLHAPSKKRFDIGAFEVLPGPQAAPVLKFPQWGPRGVTAGKAFNVQADGTSALWFGMDGAVHPNTMEGWIGDRKVALAITSHHGGSLAVSADLLAKPGTYPVYLIHVPTKTRYDIGPLEIAPAAAKGAAS